MRKLRVGVIGVGSLGRHHGRIYRELEGAELVGVADVSEERARTVAESLGCRAFNDFRELLPEVEAVSLAVPTEFHCEVGVPVLEAGVHVLVEKPLTADLDEADRLIEAGRRTGRVLQVGHTERFNPVLRAVLPHLKRPRFFEAHRLGVFVARSLDVDVILDLMIHDLDLVLWLVGAPIREIRAVGIPVLTPKIDIANARIEFANGCVANLTASRVSRERVRKLRLFQARDYVSLDFHNRTVEMYSLASEGGAPRIVERHPEVDSVEPLRAELEAFLEAAAGGRPRLSCGPEEGRAAVALALEILAAARVSLEAAGDDAE